MSVTGMNVKVYAVFKTKCINIRLGEKKQNPAFIAAF